MPADRAVWERVRSRLRSFPERLAACGAEAAAYGRCVRASTAPGGRLGRDLCAREFEALRSCVAAAASRTPPGGRPPLPRAAERVDTRTPPRPLPGAASTRANK
ncbi:NADH dehydrogenase [ubiquinone] 1 alpha subcomplex assembly factor 8 [Ochotona curzoniae]|uniref:NADH dehydrogenase [ubiquinone] 1 alpha subcomplex assembly factor 8 n=1 Tax=Ochotona curzoniae TaxID=130825 RepID=UPI001B346735|nr:NADH dehydrogenase [ubiquinone] 1 alpha subcomplex assembly factor 8 [Ochotona curzoniae]